MTSPKADRFARILAILGELLDELRAASADELEEISDILIDELLERIPLPGWIPFVEGWVRGKLDALLPEGIFQAIAAAVHKVKTRHAESGRLLT